jgi:hypothetical protein
MAESSTGIAPHAAPGAALVSGRFARERWSQRVPLAGVLFVVLVIAGGPVLEGSTPNARASSVRVIAFYTAHRDRERAGVFVLAFAFVAFLCFAAVLRARWRRANGSDGIAALVLAAAAVVVVGQSATEGVAYALTEDPAKLSASSAQTLNLLANDFVVTSAIGFLSFGLAAGIAILRGVGLPSWLGWAALVIGILFVVPPIEFAGFLLLLIWVVVVTVITIRRSPTPAINGRPTNPSTVAS